MSGSTSIDESTPGSAGTRGRRTLRTYIVSLVGLVLSGILLWWMLQDVNLSAMISAMTSVSLSPVLVALAILYASLPLRAVQWQLLLGHSSPGGLRVLLRAICLGHAANALLPARGGELVRSYLLARELKLTISRILPSVALARVLDLPALLILLVASANIGAAGATSLAHGSGGAGAVVSMRMLATQLTLLILVGAALLVLGYRIRLPIVLLFTSAAQCLPTNLRRVTERTASGLLAGIDQAGEGARLLRALLLSILCWTLFVAAAVPLLLAFSFTLEQAVQIAVVQTALTSLTFLIPAAPGAVGTFHILCLASVYACVPSADRDTVVAYALVAHLIGVLGPAVPGLLLIPFVSRAYAAPRRIASGEAESRDP